MFGSDLLASYEEPGTLGGTMGFTPPKQLSLEIPLPNLNAMDLFIKKRRFLAEVVDSLSGMFPLTALDL
jgi:hypothetical protein